LRHESLMFVIQPGLIDLIYNFSSYLILINFYPFSVVEPRMFFEVYGGDASTAGFAANVQPSAQREAAYSTNGSRYRLRPTRPTDCS